MAPHLGLQNLSRFMPELDKLPNLL